MFILCKIVNIKGCVKFCYMNADICQLPKEAGSCNGQKTRFYYNSASQKCEEFRYSGCQGNANRFKSLENCQQVCGQKIEQPETPRPAVPETTVGVPSVDGMLLMLANFLLHVTSSFPFWPCCL